MSFVGCAGQTASGDRASSSIPARPSELPFTAVPKSIADSVTVPSGYTVTVLYRLGDPIATGVSAYGNNGTDAAATFAQRAGDHHDGMHFFGMNASGSYDASVS
jgi:secreted PhoX family phosphatase